MGITRHEGSLVSDEALYATEGGAIVSGDHPSANMLIAAAGVPIPQALAEQYGITESAKGKAAAAQPKAKEE